MLHLSMKDYLSAVVTPLLEDPQALKITETLDEKGLFLLVNVSRPDMGRVIGKGGENIEAIRTILRTIGGKVGQKVSLKVNEPA